MVTGAYIWIITLNVNGLNAPTRLNTDWFNGYRNKTQIHDGYKRPTSDLGTHID